MAYISIIPPMAIAMGIHISIPKETEKNEQIKSTRPIFYFYAEVLASWLFVCFHSYLIRSHNVLHLLEPVGW